MSQENQNRPPSISVPLLAGFGSLLILMAFANIDAVRALREIHEKSEKIRQDYLTRNQALSRIRSGLYLSGTYMRDYLAETAPGGEEEHRKELEDARTRMFGALQAYKTSLNPDDSAPQHFQELDSEVREYWSSLDPVLRWNPEERKQRREAFMRKELAPRRAAVLQLSNKISRVNERELSWGNQRLTEVYASYRQRLIWIAAATLLLGIAVAVMSIREILRLEHESRRRYQEVKQLSAKLLKAQEDERRSISRELHDEVGQSLTALLMEVGNLGASVKDPQLRSHLESIKHLADSSVKAVRSMALLLRPSMLDDLGLVPALEWQAREVSKRTGLEVQVNADDLADQLPDDHKTCIYRVVQEALHNCSRHAEAQSVRIDMLQKTQGVTLSIQDDGKGFDASRVRGLGLLGMEERIKSLGGSFEVHSSKGNGTLLSIRLPIKPCPN